MQGKAYAVESEPNGVCTLAVHEGDPAEIRAAVEAWLPSPKSGLSVSKQEAPPTDAGLQTTNYEFRGGKVAERWVLTVSSVRESSLRALLSWSRL